jgi:hypothetical protein
MLEDEHRVLTLRAVIPYWIAIEHLLDRSFFLLSSWNSRFLHAFPILLWFFLLYMIICILIFETPNFTESSDLIECLSHTAFAERTWNIRIYWSFPCSSQHEQEVELSGGLRDLDIGYQYHEVHHDRDFTSQMPFTFRVQPSHPNLQEDDDE